MKINKPVFENNFWNTVWKVQRNPVFHSHTVSLRLLPSHIQGTQCDNQWPYSDTLLSPKVHVSCQAHACCRACFGQIDGGKCSGSEVWVEGVHCPANPLCSACFPPPSLPPGNYWSFHCLHNLWHFQKVMSLESYRIYSFRLASFRRRHV